jgi:hypothetical protein
MAKNPGNELSNEFEINGVAFQLRALPYKEARALLPAVTQLLGPVLSALVDLSGADLTPTPEGAEGDATPEGAEGDATPKEVVIRKQDIDALKLIVSQLDGVAKAAGYIPQVQDVFVRYCTVRMPSKTQDGRDAWVDLAKFDEQIFRRKHVLALQWLAQCIVLEYGTFLAELGLNLETLTASR